MKLLFLCFSFVFCSSANAYINGDVTFDLIKTDDYGRSVDYYVWQYTGYYYLNTKLEVPKTPSFIYSTVGVLLCDVVASTPYFQKFGAGSYSYINTTVYGFSSTYVSLSYHF
jgi:hypothetical protein